MVEEIFDGFLAAHEKQVRRPETSRVVVRRDAPVKNKVGMEQVEFKEASRRWYFESSSGREAKSKGGEENVGVVH